MSDNTGPVEAAALTQMGSTFAERKAAREALEPGESVATKQVDANEDKAENKAVKRSATRKKG